MLRASLIILVLLGTTACGQKGPLFKPDADEPEAQVFAKADQT